MGKAVHAACCCISAFSAHVESELTSRCSASFLLFNFFGFLILGTYLPGIMRPRRCSAFVEIATVREVSRYYLENKSRSSAPYGL